MTDPALAYDVTQFERPSVTADIVIFTLRHRTLQVLLIQRKAWPFEGQWAIPGGFVRMDETLEEAALRELQEETGVTDTALEQLRAFGDPGRDPRTRVITIAYTALIPSDRVILRASTDAADARWYPIDDLPLPLAFDHIQILEEAHKALRAKVEAGYVARGLLPARFTLTQLQEVYETLLGRDLDKRNFRKWILSLGILAQTTEEVRGAHRPAALYEFAG
ncbi:MAG: NUDIX domain-containing protein [Capsulimonas sp.]|uniref:NUDIX hydrolase n=1 Tax=Capsulimonas sp. TaxID=2494211 RepID=UPI0032646CF6